MVADLVLLEPLHQQNPQQADDSQVYVYFRLHWKLLTILLVCGVRNFTHILGINLQSLSYFICNVSEPHLFG